MKFLTITMVAFVMFAACNSHSYAQSSSRSAPRRVAPPATNVTQPRVDRSTTNRPGFALFELFTSEGCSSCPPADANLARLNELARQNERIITLSYHVDYWNRLGWKDPYSNVAFTKRQRKYAEIFESSSVYTPQMVINGAAEFNGSNQKTSDRAAKIALGQEPTAEIQIRSTANRDSVGVTWETRGLRDDDSIQIALVQNNALQNVTRGENANRDLRHVNVVRNLKSAQDRQGKLTLSVPGEFNVGKFHVVAFIQSASGEIRNATRANIR